MLAFPISIDTFKKSFLSGAGNVEIGKDGGAWESLFMNDGRFTQAGNEVDDIVDFNVALTNATALTLGRTEGFAIDVGASARSTIRLLWPSGEHPVLESYGLEFISDDQAYLWLVIGASGNASVSGQFAAPPGLKAKIGFGAGGAVRYEFLKRIDTTRRVNEVLPAFFADVVLPQQIDHPCLIPDAGDAVITRLSGYLRLHAGLTFGHSLTGTRDLDISRLDLAIEYALKVAASISFGYRLAGDFEVQATRGTEDGWVRFMVRKSRESTTNFAADLGVTATFDLTGLPKSPNDFIAQVAGTDGEAILKALERARNLSTMDALEGELSRLGKLAVDDLAMKWIGKVLNDDTVNEFFGKVNQVVNEFNELDLRIIHIYEDLLERVTELTEQAPTPGEDFHQKFEQVLNTETGKLKRAVVKLGVDRSDELKSLLNQEGEDTDRLWNLIEAVWEGQPSDILLEQTAFEEFTSFLSEVRIFLEDGVQQEIKALIRTAKEELNLERLFKRLRAVDSPEKLKSLSDKHLKGAVSDFIGKAFDEIEDTEWSDVLIEVRSTLDKIENFKNAWYKKVTEAVSQKFNFGLAHAYSRVSKDAALLDVEIDLNSPSGRDLALKAAGGDFATLLESYKSGAVKIHKGVLTHHLNKSTQLQINILGWSLNRLVTVVQHSKHSIEAQAGGLLHVYADKTYIEQKRTRGSKFKETVASKFLLKTLGSTSQPDHHPAQAIDLQNRQYLVRTLRNMAVEYDLSYEDEHTKAEELRNYLEFGRMMGVVESSFRDDPVAGVIRRLNEEFPDGLGKVSIKYMVKYNPDDLRLAFLLTSDELRQRAQEAMREFVSARYIGMRSNDWDAILGFAYRSPVLADAAMNNELRNKSWAVRLPGWFTGSESGWDETLNSNHRIRLNTLFHTERKYLDRLVAFDKVIDKARVKNVAVPHEELRKAEKEFVEMADDIDRWRANTFFVVFDHLIQSQGKAHRDCAMVFEITPPNGNETIRKILTTKKTPDEAGVA